MEKQNQQLTEQVAMLVSTLSTRNATEFIPKESPQHPVPRPSLARFEGAATDSSRRGKHRSRSPLTRTSPESVKKAKHDNLPVDSGDPVDHAEVKRLLAGVSEEAQSYFLQNMQSEPEKFPTMAKVRDLIQQIHGLEQNHRQALLANENGGINRASLALVPFGAPGLASLGRPPGRSGGGEPPLGGEEIPIKELSDLDA